MIKPHLALIWVTLLGAASLCFAQHPKLSPDLAGHDPEALVNVIIQYKAAPEQRHIDAVVRKGGRHRGTLGLVNGAVYSVATKSLADLADDPDVAHISLDHPVKAAYGSSSDYKLQAINADIAQQNQWDGT